MKPAVAVLAVPALLAQPAATIPPESKGMLLGEVTAPAILAHGTAFRDNLAKVKVNAGLRARWAAIRQPLTLVVVFGSWCADSQYHLPYLLALEMDPNPFIEVRYLGVGRDKTLKPAAWPKGLEPQAVHRVPTFYLFATQPGGVQRLAGTLVENPPREGQSMAEALVELAEAALRAEGR
ncbi:MAG: thioredoxin family protein [Holophagaceae bacterium]|nr:thioredoxin family protein [Holophagaceae bacterium]